MRPYQQIATVAALLLGAALLPYAAQSQSANGMGSAFNGTWKIDAAQTKLSPKPETFYIGEDWYHCTTCSPEVVVKADGTDQAVKGQAYDTLSVKQVDDDTIQLTGKQAGKVVYEDTLTVSKDGNNLTDKITNYNQDGSDPVATEVTSKRVGTAPMGVHATSGDWQIMKFDQSANGLTFTYKVEGDEVTMNDPTGDSYTARLDGGDSPVKGAYGWDTVSLRQMGPDTIEETDKRNGTVVDVSKMTVHGKTMTIEDTREPSGRTSTFTAHKMD